jgi:hypothetical protein
MIEDTRSTTDSPVPLGARQVIDGQERVHYYGYWVKTYPVPADTLEAKKELIGALTRRLFNHTEHGLNIPGTRLDEARRAYEQETDLARRRIKAGMLAGALFNRATGIFTQLVEIQKLGVEIQSSDPLMRTCGEHLKEALELGKQVRHRSGEEGIDELWGEPFKAFLLPVENFYESRYIKIAQTMRDIDGLAEAMTRTFADLAPFSGIAQNFAELAAAAKTKTEVLRTDRAIFEVWTTLVAAAERLAAFEPSLPPHASARARQEVADALQLIRQGTDLITYITRARVPMPKSKREYIERLERFRDGCEALGPRAGTAA